MPKSADPAPEYSVPVVRRLDEQTFCRQWLGANRPVVVRDVAAAWPRRVPWSVADLVAAFATWKVPVYDTLFGLRRVTSFQHFVDEHLGAAGAGARPAYLRWFTRQSAHPLPWADDAFAVLADWWEVPSWYPRAHQLFPPHGAEVDVRRATLPGKGLFVCGPGGRTRLHVDPWGSAAVLVQVTGRKSFALFGPGSPRFGGELPDLRYTQLLDDPQPGDLFATLAPGDLIFLPEGWAHTAEALEDSVSLTWNFVHESRRDLFDRFVAASPDDDGVRFFLSPASA